MDQVKSHFHPRNKHRDLYDFPLLIDVCPELKTFVHLNKYNNKSIDFSNAIAVKMLNKALLKAYYLIENWDVPNNYLIPPIPGRADYVHYLSDLLAKSNSGIVPRGEKIKLLDIGVGANCIYPIIASSEYGWNFIGSDIDKTAINSAKANIEANPSLKGKGSIYLQNNENIFKGIIKPEDQFDLSICNPPFHASSEEAKAGTLRKLNNLNKNKSTKLKLNFGGQSNELWYEGGEEAFLKKMILESIEFSKSVFWFSTLVSKESNVKGVLKLVKSLNVEEYNLVEMSTGNKKTRFIAWTFLTKKEQSKWVKERWK